MGSFKLGEKKKGTTCGPERRILFSSKVELKQRGREGREISSKRRENPRKEEGTGDQQEGLKKKAAPCWGSYGSSGPKSLERNSICASSRK